MSDIEEAALAWALRHAAGKLDPREQAEFDAWHAANPRHQGAFLRARALHYTFDHIAIQPGPRPGGDADSEPAPRAPRAGRGRRTALVSGMLAAGVAALAMGPLRGLFAERPVYRTARGEFRKVPLADRSVVSLNSGSDMEVVLTDSERRILLNRGEAWFEVAKDRAKPFIVESGDVRVRAVGTAFAVRRYGNGADVMVTEGLVEVWSSAGSARRQRLPAGTQSFVAERADHIAVTRNPEDIERRLAWRKGQLVFRNQTLADAAADFNRYNARQIVIADPALGRRSVVGQYETDQSERFAQDVQALLRVPVSFTGERITIGAVPPARH